MAIFTEGEVKEHMEDAIIAYAIAKDIPFGEAALIHLQNKKVRGLLRAVVLKLRAREAIFVERDSVQDELHKVKMAPKLSLGDSKDGTGS